MAKQPGLSLRQARRQLLEQGEISAELVDPVVARSWERSRHAGLAPLDRLPDEAGPGTFRVKHALHGRRDFIAHAQPVMEYLYMQIRDTGSMAILADERGVLLQALGDPVFLNRAERVALAPGASWNERHRGTNAIGTALEEEVPVVINGGEHYLERNGFLTCAAAPVASPDGSLLGVLDISGDHRGHHPHTFCLVRTAAQMLENRLFEATHRNSIQLRFHPLAEGIGSFNEGVVALSDDGLLIGANRAAMHQLGLRPIDLGATWLERVFQVRLNELLDWGRRHGREPLPVQVGRGRIPERLFVRVEAGRVIRSVPAPRPAAKEIAADALSALDTGCERLHEAIRKARKVLDKAIAVLLQGESGVGKELFAKAMHDSGPRRDKPFVVVDCAALPENLIEAELFGYAPGAFTGARREGSPGRVREAQGGTIFLDEIGDMPLPLQTRLLRVLQERQITPLGGGKAVAVDFALICATHRNLQQEMEAGRFRADLYYRINGLQLALPALRERTDFLALLRGLLLDMAPNRPIRIDSELASAFATYPWPGNLRQLVNALRTACALLDAHENSIGWQHLSEDLAAELRHSPPQACIPPRRDIENLREISAAAIARAIEACRGNLSEAARRLGISRNTLYRRLRGQKAGQEK